MINLKDVKDSIMPSNESWCVVECWDYSPSGYHIAKHESGKWLNEMQEDITEYVTSFALIEE